MNDKKTQAAQRKRCAAECLLTQVVSRPGALIVSNTSMCATSGYSYSYEDIACMLIVAVDKRAVSFLTNGKIKTVKLRFMVDWLLRLIRRGDCKISLPPRGSNA